MNISSLVISTSPDQTDSVISQLKSGGLCEYYAHKDTKIVVTIEGNSVNDEIVVMKALSRMPHVLNVEMIYSYCEEELNAERDKLEIGGIIPDWLNDENARAEDIVYNGKLKF